MFAPPDVTGARFPTKHRRRFPRSRAGCFTCRQRKKKCNEARPTCSGCARNRLSCAWPVDPAGFGDGPEGKPEAQLQVSGHATNDGRAVLWSHSHNSFISQNRAVLLTSHSGVLLSHYVLETRRIMTATEIHENSLIKCILPLAYIDDLVMHSVMALGGAHLCGREPERLELQTATESHYACILRGVRTALQGLSPADVDKVARILLVLIITANYEVHSNTCTTGGIFPHLRAARQLTLWLRARNYRPTTPDARVLYGYLVESYAYLVLCNCICPYEVMASRHVPLDDFLSSLAPRADDHYDGFGMLFSGCHGLFELIPRLSRHAAARLAEGPTVSPASRAAYADLAALLEAWRQPPPPAPDARAHTTTQRVGVGKVYKHAAVVFLEMAHAGGALPPGDELRARLSDHVGGAAMAVFGHDLLGSSFASVLLWPMIVVGSVIDDPQRMQVLSWRLRTSAASTTTSLHVAELLEALWRDRETDERCWGPYGLYLTMEKHGINLSLA